jgi:hypothetical protein
MINEFLILNENKISTFTSYLHNTEQLDCHITAVYYGPSTVLALKNAIKISLNIKNDYYYSIMIT